MFHIALLGFGVVGSGTAEVLEAQREAIVNKTGKNFEIKYILDLRDFPNSPFGHLVTHNFNDILEDPEVSVVIEMMGGSHPAYDFTKACLQKGKNVVTSNKEVVSKFGAELLQIARDNQVRYLFEASVGGGIPLIRPLTHDLSTNHITEIVGILNGTCNYILTQMKSNGLSFETALSQAQKLGYAEANPSADVDGPDTARKITILCALMTGKLVSPDTIDCVGIRNVTDCQIRASLHFGYSVKLIGRTFIDGDGIRIGVSPMLIPSDHPLYNVQDVFNGICVTGDCLGRVMFYGAGAGKYPTANAVVSDCVEIMYDISRGVSPTPMTWAPIDRSSVSGGHIKEDGMFLELFRQNDDPDGYLSYCSACATHPFSECFREDDLIGMIVKRSSADKYASKPEPLFALPVLSD